MENGRRNLSKEKIERVPTESEKKYKEERIEHFLYYTTCQSPEFQREFEIGQKFRSNLSNLHQAILDTKNVLSGMEKRYLNIQERVENNYKKIQEIISTLDDDLKECAEEIMTGDVIGKGYSFYLDHKNLIKYREEGTQKRENSRLFTKPKKRTYWLPSISDYRIGRF